MDTKKPKTITEDDVRYVASLARIHLRADETGRLTKNLEDILGYVHKLERLDVSRVEPTSHVLPLKNVYREDAVQPSLSQDEALQTTVQKHAGCFKVPQIIE